MSFNNGGVLGDFRSITPSDFAENHCMGLYIGGAGNVAVETADGTSVTLTALATGVWHMIAVRKVLSTNTTATLILGGRP